MIWKLSYFTLFLLVNYYAMTLFLDFISPLVFYPLAAVGIEILTWKVSRNLREGWLVNLWTRAKLQLTALLVLFHWYIIPFHYEFERRSEWAVEAMLLTFVLIMQVVSSAAVLFFLHFRLPVIAKNEGAKADEKAEALK